MEKTNSKKQIKSRYTLEYQLKIVEEVQKSSQSAVAKKYKLPSSTVSDWVKKRPLLEKAKEQGEDLNVKRICKDEISNDLNSKVNDWILNQREKGMTITGNLIREKALEYAQSSHPERNFKASNGWLHNFQNKYNIQCRQLSSESPSVPLHLVQTWDEQLLEIISGYSPECIYNCDESSVFYRSLPSYGQSSKDYFTILFTVSATGEKLDPIVIGKSKKPRNFTTTSNRTTDGIQYYSNNKSRMNSKLFLNYLNQLNSLMIHRNKNILLILENASVHVTRDYSNIQILKVSPPTGTNTCTSACTTTTTSTSLLTQPLNSGIIRNFKLHFYKLYLKYLLLEIDDNQSVEKVAKRITVSSAITWVKIAWNRVTPQTILNSWRHVGFEIDSEVEVVDEISERDEEFYSLATQLNIANPHEIIDEELQTCEISDDDDDDILFPKSSNGDEFVDNEENDHEDDEAEPELISLSLMKSSWRILREGLCQREYSDILHLIESLDDHMFQLTLQGKKKRQTKIGKYFSPQTSSSTTI